jgi:hypothetical protein
MVQVEALLRQTFIVYIAEIGLLGFLIWGGIRHVLHNKQNSEAMGVLVCLLCVLLCVMLIRSIIPFSLDYFHDDICEVQGIYANRVGNKSTSGSSGLGFYAVSITVDNQPPLHLTTIPLAQDLFPEGTYDVKAYYTLRSQMLVYIEILDNGV